MSLVVAAATGLVIWIVLWSLNAKAFDAFLITLTLLLVVAIARMVAPYLPGNRSRDDQLPRPRA